MLVAHFGDEPRRHALLAVARKGSLDEVTDAVARTGRVQPRSFTEYVREEFTPTPDEGQ